jgi:hypothetical protein
VWGEVFQKRLRRPTGRGQTDVRNDIKTLEIPRFAMPIPAL